MGSDASNNRALAENLSVSGLGSGLGHAMGSMEKGSAMCAFLKTLMQVRNTFSLKMSG